jgi:hypothetical protein
MGESPSERYSDSWLTITALPLPCFSKVLILKADRVLRFDALLKVFILKVLRWHKNREKRELILRDLEDRRNVGTSAGPSV